MLPFKSKRAALFWIAIAVVWLIAIPIRMIGKQCLGYLTLQRTGVQTTAHVVSLEPRNHQTVNYTFFVGTTEYRASGRAGFGNPDFDRLSPGMEVQAFYLPKSPQVSCLGLPHDLLINNVIPFSAGLLVVSVFLYIQYRRTGKPANPALQPTPTRDYVAGGRG